MTWTSETSESRRQLSPFLSTTLISMLPLLSITASPSFMCTAFSSSPVPLHWIGWWSVLLATLNNERLTCTDSGRLNVRELTSDHSCSMLPFEGGVSCEDRQSLVDLVRWSIISWFLRSMSRLSFSPLEDFFGRVNVLVSIDISSQIQHFNLLTTQTAHQQEETLARYSANNSNSSSNEHVVAKSK